MSIRKQTDNEIRREYHRLFANRKISESTIDFSQNFKSRAYLSDAERRELVREYRKFQDAGDTKGMDKVMERIWYELEGAVFKIANALSSGARSKRSGFAGSGDAHNDAEDLKAEGYLGIKRAVEGGTMTNKNGTRNIGFDPDGPGNFLSYMLKYAEGYMKNAHTRERRKFGMEKTSLDAPRGDDGDVDGYNLSYDTPVDDSLIKEFQDEDTMKALLVGLDDVATDREKEIFTALFGLDGSGTVFTMTEVAEQFGISKQRVDQIKKKLTKKLTDYFLHERTGEYNFAESTEENQRFLLKVGDKYASSPLSKTISNPNFAGVIYGQDQADALIKYYRARGEEEFELIPWENRSKVFGEAVGDGEEKEQTGLDGLKLAQARRVVRKVWDSGNFSGIFNDDSWQSVYSFYSMLTDNDIDYEIVDSEYDQDADGNPNRKRWSLEFAFQNQNDKEVKIYGTVTAAGAGTVENPLEKYDLTLVVF